MSLVIKGGTIVAADRSYAADVLVEDGAITAMRTLIEQPPQAHSVASNCCPS